MMQELAELRALQRRLWADYWHCYADHPGLRAHRAVCAEINAVLAVAVIRERRKDPGCESSCAHQRFRR